MVAVAAIMPPSSFIIADNAAAVAVMIDRVTAAVRPAQQYTMLAALALARLLGLLALNDDPLLSRFETTHHNEPSSPSSANRNEAHTCTYDTTYHLVTLHIAITLLRSPNAYLPIFLLAYLYRRCYCFIGTHSHRTAIDVAYADCFIVYALLMRRLPLAYLPLVPLA